MLIILSPSKTIDRIEVKKFPGTTVPLYAEDSLQLVNMLKGLTLHELKDFLRVSLPLARLNFERYLRWTANFDGDHLYPAIASFKGDVYEGLSVTDFSVDDLEFAQNHLRILSGLYGILKPLDRIQPYRLEMASSFEVGESKNLYDFWGDKITKSIDQDISLDKIPVIVNLASQEYFKSVNSKQLDCRIVTPEFKELKGKVYIMVAIHAKRARGLMSRFVIKNRILDVEQLKLFDYEGYYYHPDMSGTDRVVFVR